MTSPAFHDLLTSSSQSLEQIRARDPRLAERIGHLVGGVDPKRSLGSQLKVAGLLGKARLYEVVVDVAGLAGVVEAAVEAVTSSLGELREESLKTLVDQIIERRNRSVDSHQQGKCHWAT